MIFKRHCMTYNYFFCRNFQLDVLKQIGISHIVCIRQNIEANFVRPNFPQHFQ